MENVENIWQNIVKNEITIPNQIRRILSHIQEQVKEKMARI